MTRHTTFAPILVVTAPHLADRAVAGAIQQFLPQFQPSQAIWLSPADQLPPIEDLRQMLYQLSFRLGPEEYRVLVIPQLDRAPVELSHTLLKTLEEPPARTLLLLTVETLDSLLPTLTSRCQIYRSQPPTDQIPADQPGLIWAESIKSQLTLPTTSLYQLWATIPKSITAAQALALLNQLAQLMLVDTTTAVGRQKLRSILTAIAQIQSSTHLKLTLENCLLQLYVLAKGTKNATKIASA